MPDSLQASRDRTKTSLDPRSQRTRAAILSAARTVLTQKHAKIAIADVTSVARISRATFYTHFASLEELFIATLADSLSEVTENFIAAVTDLRNNSDKSQPESSEILKAALQEKAQVRIVAVISSERELLKTMLAAPTAQHLYAELNKVLEDQLVRSLRDQNAQPPHTTQAVAAKYMAAGSTALLTAWVNGQLVATEAELAKHLFSMYPAWLRKLAD